jgi:alpha-tubulin suppressor-like RCC1 family protein
MFRRMPIPAALAALTLGAGLVVGLASPAAAAGGVTAVAAGKLHTCAITAAGAVKCWGAGGSGQLGNGTRSDSARPVQVAGLTSGVVAIASGATHTCALTSAGAVKCWGDNSTGQLGTGTTASALKPVQVAGLTRGVKAIAAGTSFTCAITGSGAAKCWGYNNRGQLGTGSTASATTPTQVVGLTSGVTRLATGNQHACALVSAGAVKCWGYNLNGQLGNGTAVASAKPVQVVGLTSGATAVAAGYAGSCAVTAAGAARCWGWAVTAGSGTAKDVFTPVQVAGLTSGVRGIALGWFHACAVTGGGALKCWGYNSTSQLGTTGSTATTPVQVSTLTGVRSVTGGWGHSCAVTGSGVVRCWGYNANGQLGGGVTGSPTPTPVTVIGL